MWSIASLAADDLIHSFSLHDFFCVLISKEVVIKRCLRPFSPREQLTFMEYICDLLSILAETSWQTSIFYSQLTILKNMCIKKSADKKTYSTWWNFGPKSRWAGTSNTIELTFKFYFCINFEMNRMMFRGLLFYLVVRK